MTAPITALSGAATDTGLRRALNEDAFLSVSPVFLVADGMGGHDRGEVASAAAIAEFAGFAGRASLTVDEVRDALDRARDRIDGLSVDTDAGAGTTLSGVVVADVGGEGYWLALNLGDSRTYRLAEGRLEQISVDHSVVQELLDRGELTAEDAAHDRRRNVITRALGAGSAGEADYWMLPASEGDRVLVCSDGLPGELSTERIREILAAEPHPQAAATRLVHEAVLHGGRDNVTAVVVDAVAVARRGAPARARTDEPGDDIDIDSDTLPREPVGGAF
ncbi:PP2C family protein-serine/threonine phosphatase [Microbacterium marinilacus]|uniref:Protein phosphatase 2C domain-containing protein n=1 Tax=Microbacterium marinilacus TaxID=415209 RepID=A0ABP7BG09_9MICO|nr:protein phosphatase 2C domain-containing protein [Microbacterium marinilacus]MBY0689497.1 protein phosphatase 2C domain-containing protein [Microbacterium marinilacus]